MTGLHQTYDIVLRKAERLRVDLPAETTAEYQLLQQIAERGQSATSTAEDFRSLLADCAQRGGDPFLDPDVVELAARRGLGGGDVKATLVGLADQLLAAHAPAMFAAFTDRFDEAARMLVQSVSELPKVDALKAGPPAGLVIAWDRARYAEAVMTELQTLWKHLSVSAAQFPSAAKRSLLVIADVPPQHWLGLGLDMRQVSPWLAAVSGLQFSLASPVTFRERCDHIGNHVQAEADEQHGGAAMRQVRLQRQPRPDPLAFGPR